MECVTGLGLGFTNSGGTWESGIYVCVLVAVGGVGGGHRWKDCARVWEGGVVLCLCVL